MKSSRVLHAVLVGVAAAGQAAAQCAMCANAAAQQNARAMQSLNSGILLLLVPPVAIMGAILFRAFHHRSSE